MTDEQPSKVQQQFGTHAQNYVNSSVHATGEDLDAMLRLANPQPTDVVLDIATGGGHTALKFAPHVNRVVATDITPAMLEAAQAFISPQADNVSFELADAQDLPFGDATFDIVTCRIAAHHFPDAYEFVLEAARVLRPGGRLVLQDQQAPPDERAHKYIDTFERLRDPSHNHQLSAGQWRSTFLDARLELGETYEMARADAFIPWAQRIGATPETVEKLTTLMLQAPDAVRDWLQPKAMGTPDAVIHHRYLILVGTR